MYNQYLLVIVMYKELTISSHSLKLDLKCVHLCEFHSDNVSNSLFPITR